MWVLREDRNEERKKGKLHTPVYYWNHASIIRFTSTSSLDNWLYMNNRNRTFFQLISWRNRKQLKSFVYIHQLKKHAPDFLFDFPYLNFLFDFNLFLFGIFLEYIRQDIEFLNFRNWKLRIHRVFENCWPENVGFLFLKVILLLESQQMAWNCSAIDQNRLNWTHLIFTICFVIMASIQLI